MPLFRDLGYEFSDAGEGWAEITFTASPRTGNVYGIVHGGVWLVLADSAMGGALGTIVGPDDRVITAQSEFRWLRPLKGETIRARARVLRRGRALSHCTVELFDAAGEQGPVRPQQLDVRVEALALLRDHFHGHDLAGSRGERPCVDLPALVEGAAGGLVELQRALLAHLATGRGGHSFVLRAPSGKHGGDQSNQREREDSPPATANSPCGRSSNSPTATTGGPPTPPAPVAVTRNGRNSRSPNQRLQRGANPLRLRLGRHAASVSSQSMAPCSSSATRTSWERHTALMRLFRALCSTSARPSASRTGGT